MNQSISLLKAGFESSSQKTPEFKHFAKVFKKEFTSELKSIGVSNIVFSVGHFYLSGFFTAFGQAYYFSISDVRGMDYCMEVNPESCMCQLLIRTAKDYKDYSGGINNYVKFRAGMSGDICKLFKMY
jgi:hypothetical protein